MRKLITAETLEKNIRMLQGRDNRLYLALIGISIAKKVYKYGQITDRNPTQEKIYQKLLELDKIIEKHKGG